MALLRPRRLLLHPHGARGDADPAHGGRAATARPVRALTGRTRLWRFRDAVGRYVNPVTRPLASRLPMFAVLTHRGRRSGRTYSTPINVFRRGDDCYFCLTYGSDVQWVKNVLAAGSCSITTRGRVVELVEPELVTDPELRPAPRAVRFVERAHRWGHAVPANARFFSRVISRSADRSPCLRDQRPCVLAIVLTARGD
jgi:deazaflavin-dependent oxidoreductase (nitroreductase family)